MLLHRDGVPDRPLPPPRAERLQALLLALSCAVLFLRDALLPGRALVPYPPEQMAVHRAEALAAGHFDPLDSRRGLSAGGDKYLQSLAWDRIQRDRFRAFDFPLWSRDIVAGAPFVPQMGQPYEPVNALLLLWPSEQWYGCWFLLHQLLFGYTAYGFLRRLGTSHWAGLLGVVTACLGLWTQCKLHHNVILTAALPLWPLLSAVLDATAKGRTGPGRRQLGAIALWTGVSWCSGFAVVALQVSYLVVGFAALRLWQLPRGGRWQAAWPVLAGLALGGLLAAAHMVPVLQAAAVSSRGGGWNPTFLAAHGLEWDHALGALWPDLLSWPADVFHPDAPLHDAVRLPWSQLVLLAQPNSPVTGAPFQSYVETSFAVGLLPLGAAATALVAAPRRAEVWFFAAAAGLGFGFATADQPFLELARFVPGIASADLRRLLFTTAMALVVLGSLGLDPLAERVARWPALAVAALGLAGGLALVLFVQGDLVDRTAALMAADTAHPDVQRVQADPQAIAAWMRSVMKPGEPAANATALWTTALRSLLVGGTALFLLLRLRGRALLVGAVALTLVELWTCSFGAVQTVPAARITTPPAVVAPVLAATAPNGERPRLGRLVERTEARIDAWYPGNLPGYHGIEDATGYNPLPSARFEEFFTALEPDVDAAAVARGVPPKAAVAFGGAGVGAFRDPASLSHPLADLFGIRFVLTPLELPTSAALVDRTPTGTGGFRLYERTTTLPRATFVTGLDLLPDRSARLQALADRSRDVAHRLILEDPGAIRPAPRPAPPATVELLEHTDERVVVRVGTGTDGYLRLADPYDAGWRATVDGVQVPVLAADHYLRAVYLRPRASPQEVVFTYDAARLLWPRHLSLLALLLALWCCRKPPRSPG